MDASNAATQRDAATLLSRLARARADARTAYDSVERLLVLQRAQQRDFVDAERAVNAERAVEIEAKAQLAIARQGNEDGVFLRAAMPPCVSVSVCVLGNCAITNKCTELHPFHHHHHSPCTPHYLLTSQSSIRSGVSARTVSSSSGTVRSCCATTRSSMPRRRR